MKGFSEQVWTVFARAVTAAAFIMVIAVLAGCQHHEPRVITKVQVQRIEVPGALLTCAPEPKFQDIKQDRVVKGKAVMKFADKLALAGEDCRGKLGAVKRIMEAQ